MSTDAHTADLPIPVGTEDLPTHVTAPGTQHADASSLEAEGDASPDPVTSLHVVPGSTYLQDQADHHQKWERALAWSVVSLWVVALFGMVMHFVLALLGAASFVNIWTFVWIGLGLGGGSLLPTVEEYSQEKYSYIAGREGEERLVALLEQNLDGEWTLFRNLVLPGDNQDIDGVLIGPQGIFALEVKAYSGQTYVTGDSWKRRSYGRRVSCFSNPSKQAKQNAQHLSGYLRQKQINLYVNPRVVWAGPGNLQIKRPAIPIWVLSTPDFLKEDLARQQPISADRVSQIVDILSEVQPG